MIDFYLLVNHGQRFASLRAKGISLSRDAARGEETRQPDGGLVAWRGTSPAFPIEEAPFLNRDRFRLSAV